MHKLPADLHGVDLARTRAENAVLQESFVDFPRHAFVVGDAGDVEGEGVEGVGGWGGELVGVEHVLAVRG